MCSYGVSDFHFSLSIKNFSDFDLEFLSIADFPNSEMNGSSSQISSKRKSVLPTYKIGKTLGQGSFAKVKLAVHKTTGHNVAIKILNREKIKQMGIEAKVEREIKIIRLLMHPHIIRQYEVIETPEDIYVVMEYVKAGELFDYIVEKGKLHEDEARYLFQQIISGVEYCHRNMIAHRDLKPENILMDTKFNIKIADFGLSNVMHDGHFLKTSCGSPNYAAPEVISGKLYAGPEVDIWSCGVILYALLCGNLPFDDENMPGLFSKIKGEYILPDHLSYAARDLIPRILTVDPMMRISIPGIRQHPWFSSKLPPYLAAPPLDTTEQAREINEEIIRDVVNLGFVEKHVKESLLNRIQNEATVAYYLLLDSRRRSPSDYFESNVNRISSFNSTIPAQTVAPFPALVNHHLMAGLRPRVSADKKWTLGLQSQARPKDIMTAVFKALQDLKVSWKQIGEYNIKCRWVHQSSISKEKSNMMEAELAMISPTVLKFELQLYKAGEGKYVLDIQIADGPQFLFLDLSVSLLRELNVV
ncbi:SNF1-related protein kinase catalytic subunit alpha KIN12 isoform X2 [Brassica rapa]|uniref:SNF1-related protein kinase catalytic subunit alpha KIN12 isoform X2 n=1 Tax=Brassica campestris TaxID=3711 RepID=UPI00142E45AA|nr:SNF1-related protein kinase catalytic subunit alpha KIN12 isoform X2 [Brassica rapa]